MEKQVTVTQAELVAEAGTAEERALVENLLDRVVEKRRAAARVRSATQRETVKKAVAFWKANAK